MNLSITITSIICTLENIWLSAGKLATGDSMGAIHIWNPVSGVGSSSASWTVDPAAYKGHQGSVEDIQWSPSEATVFTSASSDGSVKIWDTRGIITQY